MTKTNFSIITCTYNPNVEIFNRLIEAIVRLKTPEYSSVEWIVVDNNSEQSIKEGFDFSAVQIPVTHILETTPGLTNARIAGAKETKGDWLVFFDDDNEPNEVYLIKAKQLISKYQEVKCWGPGNISVRFHQIKDSIWLGKYKNIFQERHINGEIIQNEKQWNSNYPQGTGQIIEKRFFHDYADQIASGIYSMSDRTGKSLSSGGDVQIALNVIKLGGKVGVSEKLSIYHHIEASKASFNYLKKLIYGMASGAVLAHQQVFPIYKNNNSLKSDSQVFKVVFNYFRQYKCKAFSKDKQLVFAQRMGDLKATLLTDSRDIKQPILLRLIEKFYF